MLAVIGSIMAILVYEHKRIKNVEIKSREIRQIQQVVYKIHRNLMELTMSGESAMGWDSLDYLCYRNKRLHIDSLLINVKCYNPNFIDAKCIDTLCFILEEKESHLYNIMQNINSQSKVDSLLMYSMPDAVEKATRMKTVVKKKEGFLGFLKRREIVQVPPSSNELYSINKQLIEVQKQQDIYIKSYTDSLRDINNVLNYKFNTLLSDIEDRIRLTIDEKKKEIEIEQEFTYLQFVGIVLIACVLLIISFLIIRHDLIKEKTCKINLKKIIKENEELLDMRKKIILTVSHDIRGPLGNIHNCADLASQTREKKKREPYLDDIRHSCHHILHLVNDLMDAYRINEACDLRNDTPFYLDRFLQRISDEFSRKAITKALILYSVHENSNLTVKGDADKLEQVLANLLTNAIKFTPSGNVNFHSRYSEGKLWIEIRDTGIGMNEDTLKRIFAPFERAAQNINSEGFGLGLFLTKGLVKVLDGTMDVESEPGKGSVFRLEFPLPETDESVEEDKPGCNLIPVLPKKVLVVDDDPIQLKIAEDMLGRKGINCTTCINAREVVAALRKSDYDMILTDVQMPDTDGFALLKLLRNSDIGNSRTVPVAVMTARSDGNTGIYEREGFAGYIHKPFNIHGLLSFLSTVMSQTRVSDTGEFDFSRLLEGTDDYVYMLSLVIDESRKELEDLASALKDDNREFMRKITHRMTPVWEMLGKENLLREFQKKLHDGECKNEIIHEHAQLVIESLGNLIEETEKELRKHENTDC